MAAVESVAGLDSVSTHNLAGLPDAPVLRRVCKAMAALAVVLEPQDWLRYHFYFPDWAEGLQVAKEDNGAGDHVFCLFSAAGTVLKGFDHESPFSPHAQTRYQVWPGIYDRLPPPLSALLDDPAFEREEVTFCLWRPAGGQEWETGDVEFPPGSDDGSSFLLGTLFLTAEDYVGWAQDYHETEIALRPVRQVYASLTLDEEAANRINPQADYEAVRQEIGFILGGP